MGQPSFFDNVRDRISGIAWRVYLWGVRMTEAEFLAEHERQAVEHMRTLDLPKCPRCQVDRQLLYRCPHCQSLESASQ